jgi:hypothetical protein
MNVYPFPLMCHESKPCGFQLILVRTLDCVGNIIGKICLFAHGNTSLLDTLKCFELAVL